MQSNTARQTTSSSSAVEPEQPVTPLTLSDAQLADGSVLGHMQSSGSVQLSSEPTQSSLGQSYPQFQPLSQQIQPVPVAGFDANLQQPTKKVKKKKRKALRFFTFLFFATAVGVGVWYFFFRDSYGNVSGQREISYNYSEVGIPKFIDGEFVEAEITSAEDALAALESLQDQMQFKNVREELEIFSEEEIDGLKYYKFNQVYNSIPVHGQSLTVMVDKNHRATGFSGYYIPNINIDTTPKRSREEAENIIKEKIGEDSTVLENVLSIQASDDGANQDLVYVVTAYSDEDAKEYIISANTGEILSEADFLSASEVYQYTGEGVGGETYTINLEKFFDINVLRERYKFYDKDRKISIYDHRGIGQGLGMILSPLNRLPGSDPVIVDIEDGEIKTDWWVHLGFVRDLTSTMANFEAIYDFYRNVLGRDSYDNKGSEIIINLGVDAKTFSGEELGNAFWAVIMSQMFIGDWHGVSFGSCMDVLGHEFTHGVIRFTSRFANAPKREHRNEAFETSALDEGYADVLGNLIEGRDWTIAENIEVARDASNPNAYNGPEEKGGQFYFPDGFLRGRTIEQFLQDNNLESIAAYDKGGCHTNSNVVSHAAYLMYEAGAFSSREEMAKIWYNSLLMLASYSNFEDAALAVIKAAKSYGLNNASIYKITQAFIDTKMLEGESYLVKGTIKSGSEKISGATVDVYLYADDSLVASIVSDANGEYSIPLQTGTYKIKVGKPDFSNFETVVVVKGETILDIELASLKTDDSVSGLDKVCTADDCVNFTIYYLGSDASGSLQETHETYAIARGTILGTDVIVKTVNNALGSDMLSSDGKSFYFDVSGFKVDFGWYYRGTDEKMDWNAPLDRDTEIEMKLFNGVINNGLLLDLDSLLH